MEGQDESREPSALDPFIPCPMRRLPRCVHVLSWSCLQYKYELPGLPPTLRLDIQSPRDPDRAWGPRGSPAAALAGVPGGDRVGPMKRVLGRRRAGRGAINRRRARPPGPTAMILGAPGAWKTPKNCSAGRGSSAGAACRTN